MRASENTPPGRGSPIWDSRRSPPEGQRSQESEIVPAKSTDLISVRKPFKPTVIVHTNAPKREGKSTVRPVRLLYFSSWNMR